MISALCWAQIGYKLLNLLTVIKLIADYISLDSDEFTAGPCINTPSGGWMYCVLFIIIEIDNIPMRKASKTISIFR